MAITAISNYDRVQNVYAYHNTHFNQVAATPVSPVQKTTGIAGISSQEDQTRLAVTYRPKDNPISEAEQTAAEKYTADLKNIAERGQKLQYDLSNPYEMARRSVDQTLVTGMYLDITA